MIYVRCSLYVYEGSSFSGNHEIFVRSLGCPQQCAFVDTLKWYKCRSPTTVSLLLDSVD